jgi:hypothetical protein
MADQFRKHSHNSEFSSDISGFIQFRQMFNCQPDSGSILVIQNFHQASIDSYTKEIVIVKEPEHMIILDI